MQKHLVRLLRWWGRQKAEERIWSDAIRRHELQDEPMMSSTEIKRLAAIVESSLYHEHFV